MKKAKTSINERQEAIAKLVWSALRRNDEYKKDVKNNGSCNKIYRIGNAFNFLESQRKWGILEWIPPEKKFGQAFHVARMNKVIQGRADWAAMFLNYIEPVSMRIQEHPFDSKSTSTISCTLNLNFPRPVIIEQFKRSLSKTMKVARSKGHKFRFRIVKNGKLVDVFCYNKLFSVYDKVAKIKQQNVKMGKKKVHWKLLEDSLNMKEKKIRDAHKKAKQLIEGGFRLIS